MKRKIITTLLVVAFGLICSILASYYTASNMSRANNISLANSNLYDLSYIVDALEELKKSETKEPIIQDKLETILVVSLITLRATNPDIENLQGTPKNTLCRIIKYNREVGIAKTGIGKSHDKEVAKLAVSYLKVIEPALREISEKSAIPFHECNDLFGIKKKYKILK